MKRLIGVVILILLCAGVAMAQEYKYEVAPAFAYTRSDRLDLKGGGVSVARGLSEYLSVFADVSRTATSSKRGVVRSGDLTTYLFGLRYSGDRDKKLTPFGQVFVGGAAFGGDRRVAQPGKSCTGECNDNKTAKTVSTSSHGLAYGFGAGVDYNLTKRISWRAVEADLIRAHGQSNVQLRTAIVFRF